MIERIIELTRAGFKIEFEIDPWEETGIQVDVVKDGRRTRRIVSFDDINNARLPAEVIVMCAIEQMVNEINEYLQAAESRMLMDFGI